jgi:hypothetical protein
MGIPTIASYFLLSYICRNRHKIKPENSVIAVHIGMNEGKGDHTRKRGRSNEELSELLLPLLAVMH